MLRNRRAFLEAGFSRLKLSPGSAVVAACGSLVDQSRRVIAVATSFGSKGVSTRVRCCMRALTCRRALATALHSLLRTGHGAVDLYGQPLLSHLVRLPGCTRR